MKCNHTRRAILGVAGCVLCASEVLPQTWIEQGPAPIQEPGYGQASGAINGAAVDPSNPARIFVATVNGGIWLTINGTNPTPYWTPLTDYLPTLAISSIAFSPTDPT